MVRNNVEQECYELLNNEEIVAVAKYKLSNGIITFTHTQTMPQYQSQGYASDLAREALDDVRTNKLRVVASCAFIASFINQHPEYQALLQSQR